ncbi:MAG: hypothetical protein RL300_1050 [Pseudomonadota bacterium]
MKSESVFTPTTADFTALELGLNTSAVQRMADAQTLLCREFPLSVDALVQQSLRHEPPRPIELEHAIELTEEVVMQLAGQFAGGTGLRLQGPGADLIASTLAASGIGQPRLTLDEVETLFNRLVAVSQGRPASQDKLATDARFVAAMLILREFMHHMHFAEVTLPSTVHNIQN